MTEAATRKAKSEPLDKTLLRDLKRYLKKFNTKVACAASIGINRNVLAHVIETGRCHPDTKEKILTALSD